MEKRMAIVVANIEALYCHIPMPITTTTAPPQHR